MKRTNREISTPKNKANGDYSFFTPGKEINMAELVRCFELAMKNSDKNLREMALKAICKACQHSGFASTRWSANIVRIIADAGDLAPELRWNAYLALNELLGVGSSVYTKFDELAKIIIAILRKESGDLPDELVEVVVSLLSTSLPLLNAQIICELQSAVCVKALVWQPMVNVLRLLNALLKFSHDEVPLPIQVAKVVFEKYYPNVDDSFKQQIDEGSALVILHSRPRLPLIFERSLDDDDSTSIASSADEDKKNALTEESVLILSDNEDIPMREGGADEKETTVAKTGGEITKSKKHTATSKNRGGNVVELDAEVVEEELTAVGRAMQFFNPE